MSDTLQAGPCVVCGDTNYNLSCGGPAICPKCDCGNFDAATVMMQAKVITALRDELRDLRAAQPASPLRGREAIARIIDPGAKFDEILGVRWSRYEIQRRDLAYAKADAILSSAPPERQ
jgi:predicted nucleic-acid-binding Zn-ribbon protein